jgi:hypothetical protein
VIVLVRGRTDYGLQASLQRLGERHGFYADVAAVYYAGTSEPAPQDAQVIPTLAVGYEYKLTDRTNLNLQGYVRKSILARADRSR